LSIRNFQPAAGRLSRAQARFLSAADLICSAEWDIAPDATSWSAFHVVAHLCQVESGVLAYASRVIRKVPLPIPYLQRFHIPFAVVELRLVKRKTPIPIDSELFASKEMMLADLRSVRGLTLALLEDTRDRDLSAYYWPHAFLGKLNFYNWFAFLAAHQLRHTKQLVDIAKNIPKRVVSS